MKILSFGHIPAWAGGRQSSGLANVIYQLAKNMADCNDVELTLAATDVFQPCLRDGNLTIMGWSKSSLITFALMHPWLAIKWLIAIVISRLRYGSNISIPGFFFKGLHLSRTLRLVKPGLVHLHGMNACIYDKIVPPNVKVIVTMHGLIGTDQTIPNQASYMKMERSVCQSTRYSCIIFIASQLRDEFISLYGIKSESLSISNAYDGNAFFFIEPKIHDKLTLLTVASLSDNKGQHRVIEAIAQSGVSCKYICIGSGAGEISKRNEALAKQYGIDYEYVGKKTPSEIREYMACADYMILPSSTEGFGLVFLETIACGVPVILPKHLPIVKEQSIIKPEINALLTEDSSSEAIAKVLMTLNTHCFNHHEVSQTIPGYTWNDIAKQYIMTINNHV